MHCWQVGVFGPDVPSSFVQSMSPAHAIAHGAPPHTHAFRNVTLYDAVPAGFACASQFWQALALPHCWHVPAAHVAPPVPPPVPPLTHWPFAHA